VEFCENLCQSVANSSIKQIQLQYACAIGLEHPIDGQSILWQSDAIDSTTQTGGVLLCHEARSAGHADGIIDKAICEHGSFSGELVEIRRVHEFISHTT